MVISFKPFMGFWFFRWYFWQSWFK